MVTAKQGQLESAGLKIAIVLSRFNEFMSGRLLDGALDALHRTGAADADIELVKVPGAFELPQAAARLAATGRYDGILCLGVLIRGATPHFEYLAAEAARGIGQAAAQHGVPIGFGVLTTDTVEQAVERAGSKGGNKGFDAAMALVEMVNLFRQLEG